MDTENRKEKGKSNTVIIVAVVLTLAWLLTKTNKAQAQMTNGEQGVQTPSSPPFTTQKTDIWSGIKSLAKQLFSGKTGVTIPQVQTVINPTVNQYSTPPPGVYIAEIINYPGN